MSILGATLISKWTSARAMKNSGPRRARLPLRERRGTSPTRSSTGCPAGAGGLCAGSSFAGVLPARARLETPPSQRGSAPLPSGEQRSPLSFVIVTKILPDSHISPAVNYHLCPFVVIEAGIQSSVPRPLLVRKGARDAESNPRCSLGLDDPRTLLLSGSVSSGVSSPVTAVSRASPAAAERRRACVRGRLRTRPGAEPRSALSGCAPSPASGGTWGRAPLQGRAVLALGFVYHRCVVIEFLLQATDGVDRIADTASATHPSSTP